MDIVSLFCDVDDFCLTFEPEWDRHQLMSKPRLRNRKSRLCLSEVMTIAISFHMSSYRNFKHYYGKHVCQQLGWAFPNLVSYTRFVELMAQALIPLCHFLNTRKGDCSGIGFIDSTSIAVCHNRRIRSHRVFKGAAERGKDSVDWFYGFKLHLVVNDQGELLAFHFTPANVDDRKPVPELAKEVWGKLFGDKGYISAELFELLFEQGSSW